MRTDRRGPGDRVIYDNPTLDSLKAKLARCRTITHALSTVKHESATQPRDFRRKCERYMDSMRDVSGGSYWPLVKQVRLYSRQWQTLKTGAVLVDAPGVHDDNSARDAVVKRKLKEADAVWIVSNIVRAVNDKTAKDLLGEQVTLSPEACAYAPPKHTHTPPRGIRIRPRLAHLPESQPSQAYPLSPSPCFGPSPVRLCRPLLPALAS